MSDSQLMLLEQLSYIHDPNSPLGSENGSYVNHSIADIVNQFDDTKLEQMENNGVESVEWAAIIRAVKSDGELMSLVPAGRATTVEEGIFCYTSEKNPDRAIVVFAGTRDGDEWIDNFTGLISTDTDDQKDALTIVDSLPYEHISVVGHSKGGNKAQYVTLLSDKVDQCVSMDGQGFSQAFLDKYWAEIEGKGATITNYSLCNDFVNILLFPVPKSLQKYYEGGDNGAMNHSPTKFYQYGWIDGHIQIRMTEDGEPILLETEQNSSMGYLHDFTCFILTNGTDEDKKALVNSLGPFLALLRDENFRYEFDGKTYTHANALDYLFADIDSFALALAYFAKYEQKYNLTEAQIEDFLIEMGMGEILEKLPIDEKWRSLLGDEILKAFFGVITDKKDNPGVYALVGIVNNWFFERFGITLTDLFHKAEDAYNNLDPSVGNAPVTNGVLHSGRHFDYRSSTYGTILYTMALVERQTSGSVSSWSSYQSEDWFDILFVSRAISGINRYMQHLESINGSCREQIQKIFSSVEAIDTTSATSVQELNAHVFEIRQKINEVFNSLG